MSNKNSLSKKIEHLRMRLDSMVSRSNNLTNPDIVRLSQELDRVLNIYNKSKLYNVN